MITAHDPCPIRDRSAASLTWRGREDPGSAHQGPATDRRMKNPPHGRVDSHAGNAKTGAGNLGRAAYGMSANGLLIRSFRSMICPSCISSESSVLHFDTTADAAIIAS